MTIGENIKKRRIELGWSQRELAKRAGYKDNSTIAKIENGKVDLPQSKIVMFSEVLDVSIADLMGWEEAEKVQKKNDAQTDIVVRMRTDDEFYSVVELLHRLNAEQLAHIKHTVQFLLK